MSIASETHQVSTSIPTLDYRLQQFANAAGLSLFDERAHKIVKNNVGNFKEVRTREKKKQKTKPEQECPMKIEVDLEQQNQMRKHRK